MSEPLRDPKAMQAGIEEYQNIQRQLQYIMMQKQQLSVQSEEMKAAQEALKTATGGVYQLVGGLMIETSKEAAKKDLAEKIETFDVRATTMGKQEEKMRTKLTDLRKELEQAANAQGGE